MSSTLRSLLGRWPVAAGAAALLVFVVLLYGCDSRREIVIEKTVRDAEDICASLLRSGLDMARPESLGLVGVEATLRNAPDEAAKTLTQWLRRDDCREASPAEPLTDEAKAMITRLLGPDGVERVTSERLTPFDAAYVRDALIDYSAADNLTRDQENDLDRVSRLFEYVTRVITLRGEGTTDVPLTAYEAHLFGRGTAEDRAWLFANLLRQLRIDAVVLRPAAASGGPESNGPEQGPWWVGVLLDDGIYLFDPEIGLPVPDPNAAPPEPPTILPRPATWAQAVENLELLVAYRREAGLDAEPVPADRLRSPRIELIGPDSLWMTAMERIELSMTGEQGVLLYDPLQDTAAGPGLYRRVVEAGETFWTGDAISVWGYPEQVRSERMDAPESNRQRLEQRIQPYLGPVEPHSTTKVLGPHRKLWQARIDHMSGRPGSVIQTYNEVRLAGIPDPNLSPADQSLNAQAADEAFYWTAHAQFGGAMYGAAATTAEGYLRQGGDRGEEMAALRTLALAAQGKTAEAAEAVAGLPETTPGLPRLKWLAARWKGTPLANEQAGAE